MLALSRHSIGNRQRTCEHPTDDLATERLDDVAHLPGGDPLQVAFGEDLGERAEERLLMALIPREDARREAPGPHEPQGETKKDA